MERRQYLAVNTNINVTNKIGCNKTPWRPFLRQLFICSGVCTSYFTCGLFVGSPTVLIPQIRREANSTEAVNFEMASWLTSVTFISGFPWVILLSILSKYVGRKIPFLIANVDSCAAFILFYCSKSVTYLLISGSIQALCFASQFVIGYLILTEYISPRYRGLFLTIKSATFYWGIWVSNAIGTFFHWKNIGLLGILCSLYTIVTIFLNPESPYWLASKGRFEDCATSHHWLKGYEIESEKELENMINSQKELIQPCVNSQNTLKHKISNVYCTLKSREFYKPTLLAILAGTLICMTGKLVCALYAIDIMKNITGSESTAYTGMLILDGVTVISMYLGCVLAKIVSRRILLLVSTSCGIFMLFFISCYLYLIQLLVISENKYVSICLLILFSIAISCGPLILSSAVCGELVPVRSRNLSICLITIIMEATMGTMLKTAPYVLKAFGMHGAFLYFGICSSVCLVLLYKYLPETKDKTLQEISDLIMNGTREVVKLIPSETIDINSDLSLNVRQ